MKHTRSLAKEGNIRRESKLGFGYNLISVTVFSQF